MLRYCANLKEIRYESTSLNRIAADKSHRVIVAYYDESCLTELLLGKQCSDGPARINVHFGKTIELLRPG